MPISSWLATYPVLHNIHVGHILLSLNFGLRLSVSTTSFRFVLASGLLAYCPSCAPCRYLDGAGVGFLLSMIPFRRHSLGLFFCGLGLGLDQLDSIVEVLDDMLVS